LGATNNIFAVEPFNASFFNISFDFTTSKSKESEKKRKEEKDIPTTNIKASDKKM